MPLREALGLSPATKQAEPTELVARLQKLQTDGHRRAEAQVRDTGKVNRENVIVYLASRTKTGHKIKFGLRRLISDKRAFACPEDRIAALPLALTRLDDGRYEINGMTDDELAFVLAEAGCIGDASLRIYADGEQPTLDLVGDASARFHRILVYRTSLANLEQTFNDLEWMTAEAASGYGEMGQNVWYAYTKPEMAERWRRMLIRKGYDVTELAFIDANGVPQLEGRSPARPWDVGGGDLTDIRGSEFFFGLAHNVDGEVRIAIAPVTFYDREHALYSEPLDIAGLLPSYLKEVSPGIYATRNADWYTLEYEMIFNRTFRNDIGFSAFALGV